MFRQVMRGEGLGLGFLIASKSKNILDPSIDSSVSTSDDSITQLPLECHILSLQFVANQDQGV